MKLKTLKIKNLREDRNLASDGAVGFDPSVAIRNELEIDDGDEAVVEEVGEAIGDEIGAVRAEGLVVESDGNLAR